jgi:dissimilatory sulfite reductase (desulfoviridin) alpha/beta subunit
MTYIIAEPCIDIKDRSCVDVCPVDCIHELGRMLVIDPEECIDWRSCSGRSGSRSRRCSSARCSGSVSSRVALHRAVGTPLPEEWAGLEQEPELG